jgi:thiol-disulfide isomerase/thioredoxin
LGASRARARRAQAKDRRRSLEQASVFQRYSGAIVAISATGFVVLLVVVGMLATSADRSRVSDFEFEVYQGEELIGGPTARFADVVSTGKPVVLNFWAGNCPPCRFEMPDIQRSYETHEDDVVFLGVDVGVYTGLGSRQSGLALLDELGITYPAGTPPNNSAVVDYRVSAMPTTVFFDGAGKVFRRWEGNIVESQLNGVIAEMLP